MRIVAGRIDAAVLAATLIVPAIIPVAAAAQDGSRPAPLPDIVVTAGRAPESIERTGSAISVVHAADIASTNPTSLVDALRTVPGLDITETGGPGGTTNVRLRGANTGQTLVLIDGIRVNDPSAASGDYDFSMFPAGAIERVEVLRGPQSALYGSDAIGGVINIITKKGSGPAQFNVQSEAGSYGTLTTTGALLGSSGPWSYAFTGAGQKTDGFSRYGYRIPAIEARFPNLEPDGFKRFSGSGRVGYDPGNGFRFETGVQTSWLRSDYDAATGAFPDTPNETSRVFEQIWSRASLDAFGGAYTHNLTVFANRTDRTFAEYTYKTNMLPQNTTLTLSDFVGEQSGIEYQGILRMGWLGSLIAGAKFQHETGASSSGVSGLPKTSTLAAEQDTRSVFGLWTLPVGERLILTAGGRVDDVIDVDRFATWRTTAAYLIPETGTKLRASAGTGGKAPTLFQLYSPVNGTPTLQSEHSLGYDAGVDQSFLNGRVTLSVTGFSNSFDNLIVFDTGSNHYMNVAQAETSGVEVASDIELVPAWLRFKTAYTYLHAIDAVTHLALARRPEHTVRSSLAITPTANWLIEPRVTAVSERFSNANETGRLAPYARLDIYTDYHIDKMWRVFARLENVTDTQYQEVLNYGTTGRAIYAGFNATW